MASGRTLVRAPDPTSPGPFNTTYGDYHLPPMIDPEVDSTVVTELWARIYHPVDTSASKHPVIIILHGNHGTCGHYVDGTLGRVDDSVQYTTTGTCPTGYTVVPNHLGYEYVAYRLASWGYYVISINANRGINGGMGVPGDRGLNLRRGRLVLRHLQQLAAWNRDGGTPPSVGIDLKGKLDFGHLGMMGHSRGGEGVLAAYNFYYDPASPWPARIADKVHFEGIFELAPVDGQTGRTFYANNVAWNVLLPVCDGDVYNLQGERPFDRTLAALGETAATPKSAYAVWGANHDFYNTEWQTSDSTGCTGAGNTPLFDVAAAASPTQQQTAIFALMGFFRSHVGHSSNPLLGLMFDPFYALPKNLDSVSHFERSFSDSASRAHVAVVDDFNGASGVSSTGFPDIVQNVTDVNTNVTDHDTTLFAGAITWQNASSTPTYFQSNWAFPGSGRSIVVDRTLEFRVALQCLGDKTSTDPTKSCVSPDPLNVGGSTDFSVAVVNRDGSLTKSVALSTFASVVGPAGGPYGDLHPIMQTVRIPLTSFGPLVPASIEGVRFSFDRASSGSIYLASVRLSDRSDLPPSFEQMADSVGHVPAGTVLASARGGASPVVTSGGRVVSIQHAGSADLTAAAARSAAVPASSDVEITLSSAAPIPVRDSLLTLEVDGTSFDESRFGDAGDTSTVTFTMTKQAFDALPQGAAITLRNGVHASAFGTLDKDLLH